MTEVGGIENGVAIGREGTLFLTGGAHDVMAFALGTRTPADQTFANFQANLAGRAAWAAANAAAYVHLIFPDKQSYATEFWPFAPPLRLGEMHANRVAPGLRDAIMYPADLLAAHRDAVMSKVDTHMRMAGSAIIAAELARRVTGHDQSGRLAALLADMTEPHESAGDLGSKLTPPRREMSMLSATVPQGRFISNSLAAGNNGMIDIRISRKAAFGQRVLIFGDSFARQAAMYLQWFFAEILFCRTGYFHPEIADAFRPDVLITSTAERYLSGVASDAERPLFLMYPWLNGGTHSPSEQFAQALSAMLSYPREPYRRFIDQARPRAD